MGKHILVVSQYFYPEQFRINDIATEWVKRGYKVTVLTGIPNYPQGRFYDGYNWIKKRKDTWNGIEIIRIPLIARGQSSIGMILNYLSFVVSGFIWNCFTKVNADIVFTFEVSPMTQALIGVWYAKKHQVPNYLYVQDLWPENVVTVTGISNPIIINPISKMVDYIYKNVNRIFATSPSFVQAICNREKSVSKEKVHYWPQYAEEFYRPLERKPLSDIPMDGKFKIIFTGNIGTAQGLQILPETAYILREENIEFVMVGDGRYLDDFKQKIKEKNVENKFLMIPRQPAERIPELLAACDVAFLSFQNDKLWSMTIPAKLQSYMACGIAIIASAEGETKRIISEAQCGVCSEIGSPEMLARNIRKMMKLNLQEMGNNGRLYFEESFEKQKLLNEMEIYLQS